jgi:glycosyltransferase involved in cell wall biosynthesis
MRVAIVHDFLMQMGGAEKVVEVLHAMYPDAPIYTSAYDPEVMPAYYRTWDIRTSFLQRLPQKRKTHRFALPLYPMAFEAFNLSSYDLVLSSSSCFAKGVVTPPHTTHVCYTHAPMRFAWSTESYLENENLPGLFHMPLAMITHYLRNWDAIASTRVDQYVANSSVVARRIKKFYRAESEIVFPPVDTSRFQISDAVENYHIMVSRAVPYKRLDLAVAAFTRLKKPLKIVGSGRQMDALKAQAGPSVQFLGRVGDKDLPGLMARARAYIMPGEEDFGIAPVEANACGRPVIAYAAGGALDTQCDGVTGVLFKEQTVDGLCDAICRLEDLDLNPYEIQAHARTFDTAVFEKRIREVVAHAMGEELSVR